MEETIKKLKFKGKVTVINIPMAFEKDFHELGFNTLFDKNTKENGFELINISNKACYNEST